MPIPSFTFAPIASVVVAAEQGAAAIREAVKISEFTQLAFLLRRELDQNGDLKAAIPGDVLLHLQSVIESLSQRFLWPHGLKQR